MRWAWEIKPDVAIFGGSPPYAVVGTSNAFVVTVGGVVAPPAAVASSGGRFTVNFSSTGQCVENIPIAVTEFNQPRLDPALQQKLRVLLPAVVIHPAAGMSTVLITQIQLVVFLKTRCKTLAFQLPFGYAIPPEVLG